MSTDILDIALPRGAAWETLDSSHQRYYSGLDAAIWFGTGENAVFMGQITELSYQLQEMVMPLFAYGDYTARRRVHGMRTVRGSFSLLYQQTHLIYQLLEHLTGRQDYGNTLPALRIPKDPSLVATDSGSLFAILGSLEPSQGRALLNSLSTQVKAISSPEALKVRKEQLQALQDDKTGIWKKTTVAAGEKTEGGIFKALAGRLSSLYSRYETLPEGFDITIDFGKPPAPTARERLGSGLAVPLSYAQASAASASGFKGDVSLEKALQASPSWTTRRILAVSLTGMSQVLEDSGRPVMENYQFIAADLV